MLFGLSVTAVSERDKKLLLLVEQSLEFCGPSILYKVFPLRPVIYTGLLFTTFSQRHQWTF